MLTQRSALPLALVLALTPALARAETPDAGEPAAATDDNSARGATPANLAVPPTAIRPQVEPAEVAGPVLSLEEALKATQSRSPDLRAARAALVASEQLSRKIWARYLPNVSAGGTYTRNSTPAALVFPDFEAGFRFDEEGNVVFNRYFEAEIQKENQWGAQLQVSQPIFVAPLIPAIKSAYTAEEIARLGTEQVERELLYGTAMAWYGAVGIKESVRLTRQQVALLEEHLRSAEAAFDAGTVPELAVLRSRIELSRARQGVEASQNNYAAARGTLAILMGRTDIAFEVPSFELPPEHEVAATDSPDVEQLLPEALAQRPDTRILELQQDIRERDKTGVWARFLPVLAASYTYRYSDVSGFGGENNTWMLMVTASVPIFEGGLRFADLAEADARITEGEARLESKRNQVFQEIRQALLDLSTSESNLRTAKEQVGLARANWKAVEAAFQVGAVSGLEVADASSALWSAELGVISQAVAVQVSELQVAKTVGVPRPAPMTVSE